MSGSVLHEWGGGYGQLPYGLHDGKSGSVLTQMDQTLVLVDDGFEERKRMGKETGVIITYRPRRSNPSWIDW